jgi:hypothetical protein
VARMGNDKHIQNFVTKAEKMMPLGRLRCKWKNNIEMDLR